MILSGNYCQSLKCIITFHWYKYTNTPTHVHLLYTIVGVCMCWCAYGCVCARAWKSMCVGCYSRWFRELSVSFNSFQKLSAALFKTFPALSGAFRIFLSWAFMWFQDLFVGPLGIFHELSWTFMSIYELSGGFRRFWCTCRRCHELSDFSELSDVSELSELSGGFERFLELSGFLGTFRRFWELSGGFGNFQEVLGTFRRFWELSGSFGNFQGVLGTFREFWELSVSFRNIQELSTFDTSNGWGGNVNIQKSAKNNF